MVSGLCIVCRPSSTAPDPPFAPRCSRVGWSSRSGTAHGFSSARRDAGGGDHEQPMMRRSNASCGLPRPLHFGPCALPGSPEPRRAAKIWERRLDGVSVVGDDARWLRARASVRRHRTRAPTTVRGVGDGRARTAYLWSVEPSSDVLRSVEVGPGRQARSAGASKRTSSDVVDVAGGNLVGQGELAVSDRWEGHGQPGFGPRARARCGQPVCRVPGHTFVTPRSGVSMKPCGHDRDELNHLSRPHRLVGHAVPELRRGRARHHAASVARQRISPSRRP